MGLNVSGPGINEEMPGRSIQSPATSNPARFEGYFENVNPS